MAKANRSAGGRSVSDSAAQTGKKAPALASVGTGARSRHLSPAQVEAILDEISNSADTLQFFLQQQVIEDIGAENLRHMTRYVVERIGVLADLASSYAHGPAHWMLGDDDLEGADETRQGASHE